MQTFTCNICDHVNTVGIEMLNREVAGCSNCGSTVRLRSMIYLLSQALYGEHRTLGEFGVDKSIRGIGLSDWLGYGDRLERNFDYTNTYFHQEPRLDIAAPPSEMFGTLDFLISSDVFEHVLPPIQRAFDSTFKLLKPGGSLIFTVPYGVGIPTKEHYPDMQDYRVVRMADKVGVVTLDDGGKLALDASPVFHGGSGDTLEMRVFGETDLRDNLARAGFAEITILNEPVPECGLVFPHLWSLPITARRPL